MAAVAQEENLVRSSDQIPDEKIYLQPTGPWAAKVMNCEDTLKLFALFGEIMEGLFAQEGEMRIASFIRSLDKATLLGLVEIATHQDQEWLDKNFSFPKALKSLLDFWKRNELDELWGEIWRAGRQTVPQVEPETPAPDGSQS